MTSYVRPPVDSPVFRDEVGEIIAYGRRWVGSPPEDSYSVDSHTERFAPLHTVADALVAHMMSEYDVDVDDHPDVAADVLRPSYHAVVRAVRVRPRDAACAPLTFVFNAYPGLLVHAGVLHDFAYPSCGCGACDEEWDAVADELEWQVLAVVAGNYREGVTRGTDLGLEYALSRDGGSRSGRGSVNDLAPGRLAEAETVLSGLVNGWRPWPRAGTGHS